jgi:hypothetical protein
MGGGLGAHMLLWALPQNSMVRLWGSSLHDFDQESSGGAQRVALKVASEVKAQAEEKLYM